MGLDRFRADERHYDLPFPLNSPGIHSFYSARYALLAVANFLYRPGASLLVPSYCCGTELDPFLHVGMRLKFYSVSMDLKASADEIASLIGPDSVGLLVTHYFGFSFDLDPLVQLCRREGVALIEDCAHAFLSANGNSPLGRTGDFSVFSLRKTLPTAFGGILYSKEADLRPILRRRAHCRLGSFLVAAQRTAETYAEAPYRSRNSERLQANLINAVAGASRFCGGVAAHACGKMRGSLMDPDSYQFLPDLYKVSMPVRHLRRLRRLDFDAIVARRRQNFLYLLDRFKDLQGFQLPVLSLPEGTCPLIFPVLTEDRESCSERLSQAGLDHFNWWKKFHQEVPWQRFPAAVSLKRRLLAIPIHQDIEEPFLEAVINALS